ncbi:MAG TPA: acyl carrier protein [Pseudonocardiaceae bacterium]|nr:acyl carrier protein [Pseudonocardiaceae bacterium]
MTGRRAAVTVIETALRDMLEHDIPDLGEDTRLFDDLGLESASVLELLMIVEDVAGISVDAQELSLDDLRSIRSFADYVEAKQAEGAP